MQGNIWGTYDRHVEEMIRRLAGEIAGAHPAGAALDNPAAGVGDDGNLVEWFRFGVSAFGGPDVFAPEQE